MKFFVKAEFHLIREERPLQSIMPVSPITGNPES
jgi:hypothetical protein